MTNLTWRGQWLGWLCLAILVGFTWLPYSYYLMVSWHWIAIWQLGFFLLGVWWIWMLSQSKLPFKPLGYGLDWGVGLIIVALILSAIFSQFQQVAFWNVSIALCYGILIYVLRNWLEQGGLTIARLWVAFPIIGVVNSIISLITWRQNFSEDDPRNGLPLGHPNFVAGYILLVLPLTFFWSLSRQGWQKIAGLSASFLMLTVLYSTSSRGGFLGFLILLLVGVGFFIACSQGSQRRNRIIAVILSLIIIISIALSNPRVQQLIKITSPTANSSVVEVKIDGESEDRLLMWRGGLGILKTHPFLGRGPGNMSRVYDLYRPLEAGLSMNHLQQLHNTPMQILGELGLLGLSAYGFLIGCLGYLWYRLYQVLSELQERYLLYGIGGGLLAYGVASLTDYQLENIGLSSTLVVLVILLIGLADAHQLTQVKPIASSLRRWLRFGGIIALILVIFLWFPVTYAMYLSSESEQSFQAGKVTEAYEKASLASDIVPWDPIYNLLAGFQTLKLRETVQEKDLHKELTELALKHLQKVVDNAPNDATFNQVLGMLYRDSNQDDQAIIYFSRAVQLFPRSPLYSYYLLGREYLNQQQPEKAITALALEGLINPRFLTVNLWNQAPLSNVKDAVAQKNLKLLSELLAKISSNDSNYNQIYEQSIFLQWWYEKPVVNVEKDRLSSIVKALLLVEESPESALEIINTHLKDSPNSNSLLLLRAWIDPPKYLLDYFRANPDFTEKYRQLIQESIIQNRKIRNWLSSLVTQPKYQKNAIALTYRNYQGRAVADIPLPPEIDNNLIINQLGLLPPFPRTFPVLDQLINQVKTEELNLPHPNK